MRILLIDGTNVVMRYASAMIPNLDECLPADVAKAMRGVERAIRLCAQEAETSHVVVALDSVESWRKREYPEYKANRLGTTGVWTNRLNIHLVEQGIHSVRAPGFEADDIIATLVARSARAGHTSAVLSGDSDLLALSSIFCTVFQFGKANEARFVARSMSWVAEKYQIATAGHLRGYKALVGEPGDNLPGVHGIGPIKARKLLAEHGTIEKVMGSGALTVEQVDQCMLMLRLVTLVEDVPIDPIQPSLTRLSTLAIRDDS